MKLLTQEIRRQLPLPYATEGLSHDEITVRCKFFTPDASWTWYVIEFDGEDEMFGLVVGFEVEMGYFSLSELQDARGPLGLPIERDIRFRPCPLNKVPEYGDWAGRSNE